MGVILVMDIFLWLFYSTGLITQGSFRLTIATLPINYYLFSWICNEVVSWGYSKRKEDKSRFIYIGESKAVYIQLLFVLFFGMTPLVYDYQCIRGEKIIYLAVIFFFSFLFLVTLFTIRVQCGKIIKCVTIAWISIAVAFPMAEAFVYDTCSDPVRYVTSVWDSTEYNNRGRYYRVKVLLRDGSMAWLNTDETLYHQVKDGGVVLIYEKTGIFDIQFAKVRLPETDG